jgi:hypothetical protein
MRYQAVVCLALTTLSSVSAQPRTAQLGTPRTQPPAASAGQDAAQKHMVAVTPETAKELAARLVTAAAEGWSEIPAEQRDALSETARVVLENILRPDFDAYERYQDSIGGSLGSVAERFAARELKLHRYATIEGFPGEEASLRDKIAFFWNNAAARNAGWVSLDAGAVRSGLGTEVPEQRDGYFVLGQGSLFDYEGDSELAASYRDGSAHVAWLELPVKLDAQSQPVTARLQFIQTRGSSWRPVWIFLQVPDKTFPKLML